MQRQIHQSESELAHLGVGGAEIARVAHLLQKLGRDRRAGLVVPRKQIQRLAFPGPVLHDLRRQLHEIPRHVHAGEAAQLHAAQTMVQQMAELVKNGLDLAMRQQRRAILAGRRQVAADQAQMRILTVRPSPCASPVIRVIHPGAPAFVLARKPVGVKSAHQIAARGRLSSWIS